MPASDLRLRNTGEYKILRSLSRRFVPDAGGARRRRASTARRYLCGLDLTTAPIRSAASLVMRPVRRAFFNARRGNLPGIRPWCAHRRGDREFDNSPVGGGAPPVGDVPLGTAAAAGPRRVACARARLAEGAPRAIVSPLAARGAGFINRSFFGDCSSTCTRSEWCMKVSYHKPGRRARLDAGRHLGVSRRPRGGAARRVFRVRRRRRTLPQLVIATRSDGRACLTVGFLTSTSSPARAMVPCVV